MAANKRKIQANAQKYLQKGQFDKALKEYQGLVQLDPRDSNARLKMGDIHLRQGNKDLAAEAYIKVAEQFMKDGFDAKAVAIYKQVGKIDPELLDIYEPLAELYQRLGLTSEALAALQTAADAFNKEGRKRDALALLRKMATLDPTNTTSRLKIADLLRQADMEDDAMAEYLAVADELERQGARDELVAVYERILEIDPERNVTLTALTGILVEQGPPGRAQPFAERLVAASPDTPDGHEFLAKIHVALGREDAAQDCYRTLAELYRRTGDDDRAREISQRIFGSELAATTDGGLGGDLSDLPSEPQPEPDEDVMEETLDLGASDSAFSTDAEQLLAEASVYLRYGKAERAIATLDTLLSTEPDHRAALEKLGEAHAEHGDPAKAVAVWEQAEQIARVEDDSEAVAVLRERIASLAAAAAVGLGGDSGSGPPEAAPPIEQADSDDATPQELDDPAPQELNDAAPQQLDDAAPQELEDEASLEPADEPSLEADDMEVEIDLGFESESDEPAFEDGDADVEEDGDEIELDLDDDLDLDVAADEPSEPAEVPTAAEQTIVQGAPDATVMQSAGAADATMMQMDEDEDPEAEQTGSSSTTTPQQIAEHLEEADFYFEQNLFDEAEALYNKVVEAAPQHPQAMVRLGEIAAKRGEDPAAAGVEAEPAESVPAPVSEEASAPAEDSDEAGGADLTGWDDDVDIDAESDAADHGDEELDIELDVSLDDEPGLEPEDDTDADTAVSEAPPAAAAMELTDPELGAQETADSSDEGELEFEPDLDAEPDDTATSFEATSDEVGVDADTDADLDTAAAETETEEAVEDEELFVVDDAEEPVAAQAATEPEESVEEFEESTGQEEAEDRAAEPDEDRAASLSEDLAAELEGPDESVEGGLGEAEGDDASFDLAAELSDVFDGEEGAATESPGDTDDGFDAIFREFKKGVKEQLSDSDFEAHYDLGIAYREMGLLDDAVAEFGTALGSDELKLPSLHMLGLCALDQGQPQDAASRFEQALSLPAIPDEQQAALRYDFGRALQESGDAVGARAAFEAVAGIDPEYQDVGERLAALDSGDGEAQKPEVESFESFDDLIAEAESVLDDDEGEDEAGEEEALVDEAEAVPDTDEPLLEAVVEPERAETLVEAETTLPSVETLELEPELEIDADSEPEAELESESESEAETEPESAPEPPAKKPRRKKKISF